MIKQGLVPETIGELAGPGSLPPLNNLPQWSRIHTLDRARYPKPFLKDRLQPLPNPSPDLNQQGSMDSDDRDHEIIDTMDPSQRIQHLEKSIHFLKSQHQEVLSNLHEEIDKLKRENKELQFRIIMITKNSVQSIHSPTLSGASHTSKKKHSSKGIRRDPLEPHEQGYNISASESTAVSLKSIKFQQELDLQEEGSEPQSQVSDEKLEELKIIFLEEEIKELKRTLKEESNRNNYLSQLLEQAEKQRLQRIHQSSQEDKHGLGPSSASTKSGSAQLVRTPASTLPFNTTFDPFLIQPTSQPPRPPNLSECEVIIKHLQQVNDQQAHELCQLKSDLRDVLYSHKWTPDAYLLAKAYIAEDDAKEAAADQKLPRIQLKHPTRKLPDIAYISKDAVSLPALKTTVGNKAVERRKRTQILQKARLRREGSASMRQTETVDH